MIYDLDNHLVTIKSFENSEKAIFIQEKIKKGVVVNKTLSQSNHQIFVINIENFQKLYSTNGVDEYLKFTKSTIILKLIFKFVVTKKTRCLQRIMNL